MSKPILALVLLSTAVAFASNAKADIVDVKPGIGIGAGIYFPTNSTIRNVFGDSIFQLGVSLTHDPGVLKNGKFGVDLGFITSTSGGDSFYLLQGLATYQILLTPQDKNFQSYAKIGAGVAYADYVVDTGGNHYAAKRGLPTALAEVGVYIGKNFHVSAGYDVFTSTSGFNFNGLNLQATYTVFRF